MSLTAAVHQVSRVVLVVKVTGFEIETIAAEWTTTTLSVEEQLRRKLPSSILILMTIKR